MFPPLWTSLAHAALYPCGRAVLRLLQTGADLLVIPFKGGQPATLALLSGEVDMIVNDLTTLKSSLASGKLRARGGAHEPAEAPAGRADLRRARHARRGLQHLVGHRHADQDARGCAGAAARSHGENTRPPRLRRAARHHGRRAHG